MLSAVARLESVSQWLLEKAANNKNEVARACVEYLHLFGYVAYAWMWSRMATAAQKNHAQDRSFIAPNWPLLIFISVVCCHARFSLEASIKAGSQPLYRFLTNSFDRLVSPAASALQGWPHVAKDQEHNNNENLNHPARARRSKSRWRRDVWQCPEKALWQRWMQPDELNRINLGCRALLVQRWAQYFN